MKLDEKPVVNLELTTVSKGKPPIELEDLVDAVEDQTRSCTELERLEVAVEYGELLKGIGDDLVGHFVEGIPQGGASSSTKSEGAWG